MSGPYDQQAAIQTGNVRTSGHGGGHQSGASHSHQHSSSRGERRLQRSGSSTTLSSGSDARLQKGVGGAQVVGVAVVGGQQAYQASNGFGGSYGQSGGSFGSLAGGQRRPGRHHRQVFRLPDQGAPQVRQIRRRLATPEPDTLERVYIQRAAQEVVEEITEIPTTPPPRVQERTVVEPAGPPQVIRRTIRVPPRSGGGGGGGGIAFQPSHGSVGFGGGDFQASSQLLSAGSYGNVQQASAGFSQFGGSQAPSFGGSFAPAQAGPAFGAGQSFSTGGFGGGSNFHQGQQSFGFGSQQPQQGFGFGSQQPQQSMGIPQAFCFQV